jgi:AbrB family looped-hinge helix DNA binding protein
MESVKLGRNGQIAIPRAAMKRLSLSGGERLLLDVLDDGSIRLRPAAVLPIELYSDASDLPILAAALQCESDVLVSGIGAYSAHWSELGCNPRGS